MCFCPAVNKHDDDPSGDDPPGSAPTKPIGFLRPKGVTLRSGMLPSGSSRAEHLGFCRSSDSHGMCQEGS